MKTKLNPLQFKLTLTDDELAKANELQLEYTRLFAQLASLKPNLLRRQSKEALLAYQQNPSAENFEEAKRATRESRFWSAESQLRFVAADALRAFITARVWPWAKEIVDRGVDSAARLFKNVKEEEDARHRELTGRPARNSEITAAARLPLMHLDSISRILSKPTAGHNVSPETFLEAFKNVGTGMFVEIEEAEPLDDEAEFPPSEQAGAER